MNHTPEETTNLLLFLILLQSLQFRFAELALITDNPPNGVIQCADALDEAERALLGLRRRYDH